jgi:hypothetical protein
MFIPIIKQNSFAGYGLKSNNLPVFLWVLLLIEVNYSALMNIRGG